jgi:hypothetical protein
MAEIKFSQLTTAAQLTNDDIFALAQMQGGSLSSVKTSMIAVANFLNTQVQYTTAYNTQAKTTAGAINELRQLISLIPQFSIEVVEELPTEDISETTIYLVPAEDPEVGNYYEEYIHVNDAWELVGTTAVDLSAYYTKLEVDGLLATKASVAEVALKENKTDMPTDVRTIIKDCKTPKSATITNGMAQFECIEENLVKGLKVTMNPIQSGSGDPSPTNIRPISGRTEASVTRTAGEDEETKTHQYSETIYGGVDDFVNGGATSTMGIVDLGTLTWSYNTVQNFFYAEISDMSLTTKNLICDSYVYVEKSWASLVNGEFGKVTNSTIVRFHNDNYTTASDFKTAMSGVQLCYELATPTTISTSAEEITTVAGTNIISGTEPISECKYTELATVDDLRKIIGGQ